MKNILSIDLEDWHQIVRRRAAGQELGAPTPNVLRQMDRLLGILDNHTVTGTFFVMGAMAEALPDLVRRVAVGGHEIASHGYLHLPVYLQTPKEFREDTLRSKGLLEDITGEAVLGYRAAEFSIRRRELWALDVLAELGFSYDSSIFPVRHRRYGIPSFPPDIRAYRLPGGGDLVEIPPSSLPIGAMNFPVAGGGYFRLLPSGVLSRIVSRLNRDDCPMVTYMHPYEFDSQRLDVFESATPGSSKAKLRSMLFNLHQNVGRSTVPAKLDDLLSAFEFTSCRSYLDEYEIDGSSELF